MNNPEAPVLDAEAVRRLARSFSSNLKGLGARLLARWRPYVLPFERILKYLPEGGGLLDLGCGSGFFIYAARKLCGAGFAAGVDISPRNVAAAEEMAGRLLAPGSFAFIRGAGPEDWPAGAFDAVTLIDVLHHIPPAGRPDFIRAAAHKARRLLIIKDMRARPLFCGLMNRLHDLVLARQWITYMDFEAAIGLAAQERLTLTADKTFRALWYAHRLLVFSRPETAPPEAPNYAP